MEGSQEPSLLFIKGGEKMFNAFDFIYDGKSSISENVKMLYVENSVFEFVKSIPDKEISMFKTKQSSKWNIIGVDHTEPLSFEMQIMIYSDDVDLYADGNPLIKRNHLSRISHWLFDHTEFKKLQIMTDEMKDSYFMAIFQNVDYFEAGGDVCGFKVTVLCDTIGAYEEKTIKKNCSGNTSFAIQCPNDGIYEIHPKYTIELTDGAADITVNGKLLQLKSLTPGSTITIDTETLITESSVGDNLYVEGRYNKAFPVLTYGKNNIQVDGNCVVSINYKLIKEVGC